jgi:hypothetical protein
MLTHSLEFSINRCNQTLQDKLNRPNCHSDTDISEWIKDVRVELWGAENSIDFTDYSKEPYYRLNNLFTSIMLDPKQIKTTYAFLSKTVFDHLDSWLPAAGRLVG